MAIAFSLHRPGQAQPARARSHGAEETPRSCVPLPGVAVDAGIARADNAFGIRTESAVDRIAYPLDTAGLEHRMIHPRRGSQNMER